MGCALVGNEVFGTSSSGPQLELSEVDLVATKKWSWAILIPN